MNNRIAVIDLGTNTCNLLIASYNKQTFQIIYQGKEVVKLGKNGIDKNLLNEDGLERAVQAIQKQLEIIKIYSASNIEALATSAIREAINQDWFLHAVKEQTGLELLVISGGKEADLIFKGVKLAFGKVEDHSIILDIGGGSIEFILTEADAPIWKQSFPLGIARIINQIPPSNPISPDEITQIQNYFESGLDSLWKRTKGLGITNLIGCSGAFDTLADLIDQTNPGSKNRIKQELKRTDFERIYEMLINSTITERTHMKGMESIRIEMIVPAVILIKLVIERLKIQKIHQTDFALREGILYEHIFS